MTRTAPLLALASGLAFAAFPLLRPWGDTTGDPVAMAEAFASPAWVAAHLCGAAGWVLLAAAAAASGLRGSRLIAAGAVLTLLYYGAETFALHELGRLALADDDSGAGTVDLMTQQAAIRGDLAASVLFAAGLLLRAAGTIRLATSDARR